jgi:hypothetical protein
MVSQPVTWGEKPGLKNETTFPAAANAAMRLALMTANFCMERNAGGRKRGWQMLPVGRWESRVVASTTDFPDFQSWIGV